MSTIRRDIKLQDAIRCKKCGKPSTRILVGPNGDRWLLHFTNRGCTYCREDPPTPEELLEAKDAEQWDK